MAGDYSLRAACATVIFLAACHAVQAGALWQEGGSGESGQTDSTADCGRCTLDYDPVCGKDNSTYSNKCYAECQLGIGGWTPGRCPQDEINPVAGCIGTARCANNPCEQPWPSTCQNPLPADAVCFLNACTGIQYQGQELAACAPLWVDPASKEVIWCDSPVQKPCTCTRELKPVCGSNGKTYGNKCLAACELGRSGNWTEGECTPLCTCTKEFRPVCGSDGNTYGNKCMAACELGRSGNWTEGACKPPCTCTKEFRPVCGSDGKTYGNKCMAACELGRSGNWTEGACMKSCICTMEYAPVCGSDGKTYGNACAAACELGEDGKWTDGECGELNPFAGCLGNVRCKRNTCDDGCDDVAVGAVCFQNTCTGQVLNGESVAPCAAIWVDPVTKEAAVCPAPKPSISCSSNGTVACLADPCAVSSCPADPTATCLASYCSEGSFQGQLVGPCEAVYIDAGGNRVECVVPDVDIYSCPPNAALHKCVTPLPCDNATCPGSPSAKCITKPCISTFRGVELPACSAIWVNPDTDELVTSCALVAVPKPTISCPMGGSTVRCLADPCAATPLPDCPAAAVEDAVCETSYCMGGVLSADRTKVPPCSAVWRQPNGTVSVCSVNAPFIRTDCICPARIKPVCTTRGETFDNSCEAACAGQEVAYLGLCVDPAHTELSPLPPPPLAPLAPGGGRGDCVCTMQYDPVCGTDGETYGNACQAGCLKKEVAYAGQCTSLPSCDSAAYVTCLADLCSLNSCPADPTATCMINYCLDATFQGQPVAPCETLYVDASGNRVDCKAGGSPEEPTISCSSDDMVQCFVDPCAVSSCPADPSARCLASYCAEGSFQGQPVGPCEAVYVDAGGKRVDCKAAASASTCSCPFAWDPVCAKANHTSRTYPNSCAATCANATVRKTGKCQHCNGDECMIGKMNDVCFLAAPSETQCWSKKYECRAPPEGSPAGSPLGRCLPKANTTAAASLQGRRMHRHLLTELAQAQ